MKSHTMKKLTKAIAAAALLATTAPVVAEPIIIRNVSVIPMHEEGMLDARDVVIDDGTIIAIRAHDSEAEAPEGQAWRLDIDSHDPSLGPTSHIGSVRVAEQSVLAFVLEDTSQS